MNELIEMVLANGFIFPLGFVLGIFYFSCLWWTVQRLTRTKHPVLLMVGSGLARLMVALVALYFLIGGHWERLIMALLGFLLARTLLIARWRPQTALSDLALGDGDGY